MRAARPRGHDIRRRRALCVLSLGVTLLAATPAFGQTLAQTMPAAPSADRLASERFEPIVVKLRLNGVDKGEWLAYMTPRGDFLFKLADLRAMGVAQARGHSVMIDGEASLSIKSVEGAVLGLREKTLELEIQLPPELLPRHTADLGSADPRVPVLPRAPGGFLNYRLGYADARGGAPAYLVTTELAVSLGRALLMDNRNIVHGPDQSHGVRLQTLIVYDEIDELRRWVVGDSFASSGDLGGTLNLGGLSLAKVYQINPYLLKRPLAGFSGVVALPSTAEIYVDGARVRTERLAPGGFSLQNLQTAYPGLHDVDIVIRDPFGREQRVGFPYFFTDQLLAGGLHEYSYNLGFLRENYGSASNQYGGLGASAFHRYGWSDALTVGFGGEAIRAHVNLGPQFAVNAGTAGVFSGGWSWSRDGDPAAHGVATSLGHSFMMRPYSTQVSLRHYSEQYSVPGFAPIDKPRLQASASIAHGGARLGSMSLSESVQTYYGGAPGQRTTTVGYARSLRRDITFFANLSRIRRDTTGYAAFVGLTYFPGDGAMASAQHQKTKEGDSLEQLSFSRTVPAGEGMGYRVLAQHAQTSGQVTDSLSPFVQYNAAHAALIAEGTTLHQRGAGGSDSYQLSAAGAVAYVGEDFYFSRPIQDSYGLVKLGEPLAGVRVMRSGTEVGRTDPSGSAFVPNLASYQVNQLAIEPRDVPLEYSLRNTVRELRPPLRAGGIARFEMRRIRAIVGRLKYRGQAIQPIEGENFTLLGDSAELRVSTIRGGEFYVENVPPGRYGAELTVQGKACRLAIAVPDSADVVTELGDLFCEAVR